MKLQYVTSSTPTPTPTSAQLQGFGKSKCIQKICRDNRRDTNEEPQAVFGITTKKIKSILNQKHRKSA